MGIRDRAEEKKRNRVTKYRRSILLIATEGNNKTEEMYFSGFKTTQEKYSIQFVPGNFTDPENMVESIQKHKEKMGFGEEKDDRAFCVIDIDADEQKIKIVNNLINRRTNRDIEYIMSNPRGGGVQSSRSKCLTYAVSMSNPARRIHYVPEYQKNHSIFHFIEENTGCAIGNAKRLNAFHMENVRKRCDMDANPTTEVHKIVDLLYTEKQLVNPQHV